jgi:hypothetical protein
LREQSLGDRFDGGEIVDVREVKSRLEEAVACDTEMLGDTE